MSRQCGHWLLCSMLQLANTRYECRLRGVFLKCLEQQGAITRSSQQKETV